MLLFFFHRSFCKYFFLQFLHINWIEHVNVIWMKENPRKKGKFIHTLHFYSFEINFLLVQFTCITNNLQTNFPPTPRVSSVYVVFCSSDLIYVIDKHSETFLWEEQKNNKFIHNSIIRFSIFDNCFSFTCSLLWKFSTKYLWNHYQNNYIDI